VSPDAQTETLRQIAEEARATTNADRCTIFQVDAEPGEIFSRVALGLDPGVEIRLPIGRGVIGFVARTGRPLRLRDVHNDPRFDPSTDEATGYQTRSILCVPITDSKGDVRGAIQVINKLEGVFSDEDEAALSELGVRVEPLLQ
jgi:adenylate cyclase